MTEAGSGVPGARGLYLSQGNIPSRWAHTVQAMRMASALHGAMGEVRLVTAGARFPLHRPVDIHGFYGVDRSLPIVRLPLHWIRLKAYFEEHVSPAFDEAAAAYAVAEAPDFVYSRSAGAALGCVRSGLRTIVETHVRPNNPAFPRVLEAAAHPSFLGVVTVTEYLKGLYVEAGLPAERVLVWPDAVNLAAFVAAPEKAPARAALQLRGDRPLVVYAGHLYKEKGIDFALEAAGELPDVDFVFVGGWDADIARYRVNAQGLANVRFTGFVPSARVPEYLAAADIALLPNRGDMVQAQTTSPLKLFEYMASRRPIVATSIPALEGVLTGGETGVVVAPNDGAALAEGIRWVLDHPEDAARIVEAAYKDVGHYTWDRRAAEILAYFCVSEG